MEIVGKANVLLRFLSDVINQVEKYVHAFTSIVSLLEQGGPGPRKLLLGAADQSIIQPVNPSTVALQNEESQANDDIDTNTLSQLISDFLQSPLSQQLIDTFSSK